MKFHSSPVYVRHVSPLGPLVLAATAHGLAGVWFEGQRHQPQMHGWQAAEPGHPLLAATAAQLDAYFTGGLKRFELPLDLGSGTVFQQQVWRLLLAIAWGATARYGELAAQLGQPSAARAVGAAVGRNPVSIIVPCHRVLGQANALTGYAGGLPRKTALLAHEGITAFANEADVAAAGPVQRTALLSAGGTGGAVVAPRTAGTAAGPRRVAAF